jgi:hypothetical protein
LVEKFNLPFTAAQDDTREWLEKNFDRDVSLFDIFSSEIRVHTDPGVDGPIHFATRERGHDERIHGPSRLPEFNGRIPSIGSFAVVAPKFILYLQSCEGMVTPQPEVVSILGSLYVGLPDNITTRIAFCSADCMCVEDPSTERLSDNHWSWYEHHLALSTIYSYLYSKRLSLQPRQSDISNFSKLTFGNGGWVYPKAAKENSTFVEFVDSQSEAFPYELSRTSISMGLHEKRPEDIVTDIWDLIASRY